VREELAAQDRRPGRDEGARTRGRRRGAGGWRHAHGRV